MLGNFLVMRFILVTLILSTMLVACSSSEQAAVKLDITQYQVADAGVLQQRFNHLNQQLSEDYQLFKKNNNIAFSDQSILDVNQLQSLHLHAVSRSSLKPVKQAYCEMMNDYFVQMYHLGNQNLDLMPQIQLPHVAAQNLAKDFSSAAAFYDFVLNRYSSYRQAQEIMGLGCNLKHALAQS